MVRKKNEYGLSWLIDKYPDDVIKFAFTIISIYVTIALLIFGISKQEAGELYMDIDVTNFVVSVVSGVFTSLCFVIFTYYKFLSKIPDETKTQVKSIFDDKFESNKKEHCNLGEQHKDIKVELKEKYGDLKGELRILTDKAIRDDAIKENTKAEYVNLNETALCFNKVVESNCNLVNENNKLNEEIKGLQKQNQELQEQVANLKKTIEELSEPVAPAVAKRQAAHKHERDER